MFLSTDDSIYHCWKNLINISSFITRLENHLKKNKDSFFKAYHSCILRFFMRLVSLIWMLFTIRISQTLWISDLFQLIVQPPLPFITTIVYMNPTEIKPWHKCQYTNSNSLYLHHLEDSELKSLYIFCYYIYTIYTQLYFAT